MRMRRKQAQVQNYITGTGGTFPDVPHNFGASERWPCGPQGRQQEADPHMAEQVRQGDITASALVRVLMAVISFLEYNPYQVYRKDRQLPV